MQIVIDIDEEIYRTIEAMDWKNTLGRDRVWEAVHNGTPLPKCKTCQEWDTNKRIDGACYCCNWHNYTGEDFYCSDWIRKTIIEADKE